MSQAACSRLAAQAAALQVARPRSAAVWTSSLSRQPSSIAARHSRGWRAERPAAAAAAPAAAASSSSSEFEAEFAAQWGQRWPQLSAAMAAPTRHVALLNAFAARHPSQQDLPGAQPLEAQHPELAALLPAEGPVRALGWQPGSAARGYPPPAADATTGLHMHYWLDGASLLPPLLLDVAPGQRVLDMCAAPGGKSLLLAQLLFAAEHAASAAAAAAAGEAGQANAGGGGSAPSSRGVDGSDPQPYSGSLVCNEVERGRRARLQRVLRTYLPEGPRTRVSVTPHDGGSWWRRCEEGHYDRVLLDAPCSSDRHVAQQAAGRSITRADWSLRRCRLLAKEQAKLLLAAVRALRPGGRLVYSTCSILEMENDGVVDGLLGRAGASVAVVSHTLCAPGPLPAAAAAAAARVAALGGWAERTRHGWLVMPDAAGAGPMYVAVLHKVAHADLRRTRVNKYAQFERSAV